METKPVMIYALSTCSHCRAAKRFLEDCNIGYQCEEVDMLKGEERKAAIEDVKKVNPACSFPTIIIDGTVIVGFREDEIRKALGL